MKKKLTAMILVAGAMLGAWSKASAHERVQLWAGGPYWATTNLGAEKPEDYGLYFWWGDTTGYRPSGGGFSFSFSDDNPTIYTFGMSAAQLQSAGWVTSSGVLAPSHDAAHVQWGGNWRMPTLQELIDLTKKCAWTWTTINGVDGHVIRGIGNYASNSIFLPLAFSGYGTLLNETDSRGFYWSSEPATGNDHNSDYGLTWALWFTWHTRDWFNYERYLGLPIRPVQGAAATPDPVDPDPVNPGSGVLDEKDIVAPYDVPKAVTVMGAAYDGNGKVVGIVELKLGKVSKGKSKVSGSFTCLDARKISIRAATVEGIDGKSPATVSLDVKGFDKMNVTIGGTQFAGTLGGAYHVQSADVGGAWGKATATVGVDAGDVSMFAGTVLTDLLPNNEQATVSGGKWVFKKAAVVKWAKPKGATEKTLILDTAKGANFSALKLTYTPKKGTFKGSFNVYALEGAGAATKLKKYRVSVTGAVVGGVGYGVATCKKPAFSWSVTVQ